MGNKNIYLDTNIVADIIDSTRRKHSQSLKLLESLVRKNYTICISEDMITTLYYILKNKKEVLEFLQELVFIDWKILILGLDILREAADLSYKQDLDLEDVLQCLCAKKHGCKVLITNDIEFYNCGIEVMTSEEFINKKQGII